MNIIQKIGKYMGIKPVENYTGKTMIEETPKHNPIDINRLCDLQNRNDHNFKLLRDYISKETGVRINQQVLYEISLDYLLTHEKGVPIVEIIQKYKIYE